MRGHHPQRSIKIKTRDQIQNSTDLLISSFQLLCCFLSVMGIMFTVRTEVRDFHIILKWKKLQNTTAVLCVSAASLLEIYHILCGAFYLIIAAMILARSKEHSKIFYRHTLLMFFSCFIVLGCHFVSPLSESVSQLLMLYSL